jgi:hypothetical protein
MVGVSVLARNMEQAWWRPSLSFRFRSEPNFVDRRACLAARRGLPNSAHSFQSEAATRNAYGYRLWSGGWIVLLPILQLRTISPSPWQHQASPRRLAAANNRTRKATRSPLLRESPSHRSNPHPRGFRRWPATSCGFHPSPTYFRMDFRSMRCERACFTVRGAGSSAG